MKLFIFWWTNTFEYWLYIVSFLNCNNELKNTIMCFLFSGLGAWSLDLAGREQIFPFIPSIIFRKQFAVIEPVSTHSLIWINTLVPDTGYLFYIIPRIRFCHLILCAIWHRSNCNLPSFILNAIVLMFPICFYRSFFLEFANSLSFSHFSTLGVEYLSLLEWYY